MMTSLDRHLGCVQTDTTLLFSQQLPTFLLFRDRQSAAQPRWIRLHSSSNIVGATNAHYAWFTKTYGLYPSHDALQVPTLLEVVASFCRPLPTRTQQLPVLCQQCWELGVRLHKWALLNFSKAEKICNLWSLKKIYSCLFIPNCTRNHVSVDCLY